MMDSFRVNARNESTLPGTALGEIEIEKHISKNLCIPLSLKDIPVQATAGSSDPQAEEAGRAQYG
jgi:hypothetical protein